MHFWIRFQALALALSSLLSVSASNAETPSARALYEQGVRLASQKRFLDAQAAFQRALLSDPPVDAYFGLGQVELALGRPCSAVDSYLKYLEVGGTTIPTERRQAVMDHVSQLRKGGAAEGLCHPEGERGSVYLECAYGATSAELDGERVALSSAPLVVSPGRHRVTFVGETRAWPALQIEVSGGSSTYVQCTAPSVEAGGPKHDARTAPEPAGRKASIVAGWTVTGAGLGLAAATLAHFFWNQGRHAGWEQAHEDLAQGGASDDVLNEHNELAQSIERASRVTVGLAIASGVVTATGVVLLLTVPRSKKPASGLVGVDRRGLVAHVTPTRALLTWSAEW